jgi:hypothetical protein
MRAVVASGWVWLSGGLLVTLLAFAAPGMGALLRSTTQVAGNVFYTAAVGAPGALSATRQGQRVQLTWGTGTNGDGYLIFRATNTAPTCTTVTWTQIASVAGINTTNYTDRVKKVAGQWYCYQVRTTLSTWTSQTNNPITAVQ